MTEVLTMESKTLYRHEQRMNTKGYRMRLSWEKRIKRSRQNMWKDKMPQWGYWNVLESKAENGKAISTTSRSVHSSHCYLNTQSPQLPHHLYCHCCPHILQPHQNHHLRYNNLIFLGLWLLWHPFQRLHAHPCTSSWQFVITFLYEAWLDCHTGRSSEGHPSLYQRQQDLVPSPHHSFKLCISGWRNYSCLKAHLPIILFNSYFRSSSLALTPLLSSLGRCKEAAFR